MCSPDPITMLHMVASMDAMKASGELQREHQQNAQNHAAWQLGAHKQTAQHRSTCEGCGAPVQRHELSCSYCKRPT